MDRHHVPVTVADKRAVVIGGTSGIGRAIALGFAADGADVIATSRRQTAVDETAERLGDLGATTARITCDVTDEESLEHVRAVAAETLGGVDVLVASQGAICRDSIRAHDEAAWGRVIDIALSGVWRATRTFALDMEETGGSIVAISSLAARLAIPNTASYAAAKGGVEAFVRAAGAELAPAIRVNAVAPGFVITPQNEEVYAEGTTKRDAIERRTPLGRVAEPEEMIGAATFLASDTASYVTGEVITVDGGFATSTF